MTKEYFIRFWGASEEAIAKELGTSQRIWYFPTKAERDALIYRINQFSHLGLVMDLQEGHLTHKRTVATVVFKYEGHTYITRNDFGPEYPVDAVHYMYEDGNYSCDCNRSNFIREIDPNFPHLNCGSEIKMAKLRIGYVPLI